MSFICDRLENVTHGFSRLTSVDTLTGAYSRDFFLEFLDKELYRISHFGGNLTLLIMELDHLKKINEIHGHNKGDYILWEVASFVQSNVRECDMVCRFTGQTFGMMLVNYEEDDLKKLSEYLKEHLGKMDFGNNDTSIRITCKALDHVPETVILGIEPEDIETTGLELTPTVKEKIDDIIALMLKELDNLGVVYRSNNSCV